MSWVVTAIVATTAITTGVGLIEGNQQKQHALGAAQAEQTAMNNQVAAANAQDKQNKTAQANQGSAVQAAALAALRASMSAGSGFGGSLLTNPSSSGIAPTQGKTLLGS